MPRLATSDHYWAMAAQAIHSPDGPEQRQAESDERTSRDFDELCFAEDCADDYLLDPANWIDPS